MLMATRLQSSVGGGGALSGSGGGGGGPGGHGGSMGAVAMPRLTSARAEPRGVGHERPAEKPRYVASARILVMNLMRGI